MIAALAAGCGASHTAISAHASGFVPAPGALIAACHRTARIVGYPVPCPTRIPAHLRETGAGEAGGCVLHVIGPGGAGGCGPSWRGWAVGSSTTADQHLVITASPGPLRNDAKVVNGPAWYRGERVRPLGRLSINGWRIHAVFVPPAADEGSAFAHHVVLIWTVGRHTYAVGFHDVAGIRATLALDRELVRGIRLVSAPG
jgi:hypothetical protein